MEIGLMAVALAGGILTLYFLASSNEQTTSGDLKKMISETVQEAVRQATPIPVTVPATTAQPAASEYPDFDALAVMKSVPIVQDFKSWTPNPPKVDDDKVKTVIAVSGGHLTRAYFLIHALQEGRPLTQFESIYLKVGAVGTSPIGGHLYRPQSIKVPPSNNTTLLYALDDVPYLKSAPYSERKTPDHVDWLKLLAPGKKVAIMTFISSMVPAEINDITLYYQCDINEPNCSVTVQ